MIVLVLVLVLGGGVDGTYRCEPTGDNIGAELTLEDGQGTFVFDNGERETAPYTVQDDTVTFNPDGGVGAQYRIEDDRLVTDFFVCTKV